jgi:hypothetical protein
MGLGQRGRADLLAQPALGDWNGEFLQRGRWPQGRGLPGRHESRYDLGLAVVTALRP